MYFIIPKAPAHIETAEPNTVNPVWDEETAGEFILNCTVSASNIDTVVWEKDGKTLAEKDFDITEATHDCQGSFVLISYL